MNAKHPEEETVVQNSEKYDGRSFIRVDNEMIIRYKPLPSSEQTSHESGEAKTKNISVVGICFHGTTALQIDQPLVIELRLPSHESPITPVARVVWCHSSGGGYDIGLELMWLDWQADEQLAFANYIHDVHGYKEA